MTEAPDIEAVRAAIVRRFGSVHRFCKAHKGRVNRATVYMLLAGSYPGAVERQVRKIREVLGQAQDTEQHVLEAIKGVACARCAVTTRPCERCDGLFQAQAKAAVAAMTAKA